jgi:hypothetical protein
MKTKKNSIIAIVITVNDFINCYLMKHVAFAIGEYLIRHCSFQFYHHSNDYTTSCNNNALITLTGLNHPTFNIIKELFFLIFDSHSPWIDSGRKRMINGVDCLGLYLAWTQTRGSCMTLRLIFGITGTPLSVYIRFVRRIIIQVLHDHPLASVQLPSCSQI